MIDHIFRKLSVSRRIIGGFMVLVLLLVLTLPVVIADHTFIEDRLRQVTDVETRADRTLLLASARVISSRLNLFRYLQDYLPSAWSAVKEANEATALLNEALQILPLEEQKEDAAALVKILEDYKALVRQVQKARQDGEKEEATRLVFLASKTGYDIGQRIEQIVQESEIRLGKTNRAVFHETHKRLTLIIVGYGSIIILSLILASLVARSITRPVSELRAGADAFRLDRMETRIPVAGKDELTLLARTFNEMADQLGNSFNALEEREQALVEERNLLRTLIDNLPEHIYVKDAKGRYIIGNRAFVKAVNGNRMEDIIGKTDFDIFPRQMAAQFQQSDQKVLKLGNALINMEERVRELETGVFKWFLRTNVPLRDREERIVGLVGLSRDITEQKRSDEELKKHRDHLEDLVKARTETIMRAYEKLRQEIGERKKAEQELRTSEKRYRLLFEKAGDAIFILEAEGRHAGRIVDANHAAAEMHGHSTDELLEMNIRELESPDTAQMANEYIERIMKGEWVNTEISHQRCDGTLFPVEMSAGLLELGDRKYILAFGRNTEERKKAEEEKAKLESQLHQIQRMESIGTLAGGIAHNFNNLLMGIQGSVSLLLLDVGSDHPNFESFKRIENLVQSGSKLTSQLLGYAREGRFEVKSCNLNRLVKETADTFVLARREITVHLNLGEDLHDIQADQGQMEQVLLNLYVNAADAMPNGGKLSLNTRNVSHEEMSGKPYEPRPGNYVLCVVTDTGVGMKKETMKRIFEPFYTTKGLAKGTGLGLASVYGIIKGHGGYIDVESEKGRGTTFRIYVPASEGAISKGEKPGSRIMRGKGMVILVDDEEMVIEVGEQMLRRLGYDVLPAQSGRDALRLYARHRDRVDMVLLDMIMPDMGGGETYRKLKEMNPNIKVLLSSGYSIDGQATEILNMGCNGFIQKPFNLEDLSLKLREVLVEERAGN